MEKIYTLITQSTAKVIKKEFYGTASQIFDEFVDRGLIDEEGFELENDCPLFGYFDEEGNHVKGYLELNDVTEEEIKDIVDDYGQGYYKTWEEMEIE